jgi:23S rRNA A2030 N6-methylase RlmJ
VAYDHARKAGNKGDVWKHFTVVTVVDRLGVDDTFRYVDIHSGAPSYELGHAGEWKRGIGAILEECAPLQSHGYLQIASKFVTGGTYPSAWRIVVDRLSTRSRHVEVVLTD